MKSWRTKVKKERLFLLVLLVVGLLTSFSYGFYLDQDSEQAILFANIKEYIVQFDASDSQLGKDMDAAGIVAISESVDKDHGIAPYYPAGVIWYINQVSAYAGMIFWNMYTFLLVYIGICALYFLSKELFQSPKIAGLITLLFYLSQGCLRKAITTIKIWFCYPSCLYFFGRAGK